MAVRFKDNCRFRYGLHTEEWLPYACLWSLETQVDVWVTSINDGVHGANSLHPKGLAVDMSVAENNRLQLTMLYQFLFAHVDVGWEVLDEFDHVHIERDIR